MNDSFTFDPEKHEYRLGGVRLPSVTEIIAAVGATSDKSWMDPFYAERGKAVHTAIQLHLEGDLDEETLDDEVRPRFERWLRWWRKSGMSGGVVEKPMYSWRGFAGTPDLLEAPVLCDWKGSYEHGYRLQMGGYRLLLEDNGHIHPEEEITGKIVELGGKKDAKEHLIEPGEMFQLRDEFAAAHKLSMFLKRYGITKGEKRSWKK